MAELVIIGVAVGVMLFILSVLGGVL